MRRRDKHGEVGLATSAGKCRCHIGLFALRVFDAQNEHMLSHPALIATNVRDNPQREAFLAKQGVAAVTRSVAPNLAGFGEMDDVLIGIAWAWNVFLTWTKRCAYRVNARHDALGVRLDLFEDRQTEACHDAQIDHRIGRVSKLHADLRHSRTDRSHAEGQHIHGAAAHAAVEELLELVAHLKGIDPVVGRSGVFPGKRANVCAVFYAGDVARVRLCVVTAGPEILVELDERAAFDHLRAQDLVFLLRAVHPADGVRLGKRSYLLDLLEEVLVFGKGFRDRLA
jgi:hypothetical protein